ncbi:hypothetical protein HDU76_004991 [Blyttiomyces sp. JEL0837]|nr:hypothetical protein HDU76_004991 [Blyttiomyces sp. JEL0837]
MDVWETGDEEAIAAGVTLNQEPSNLDPTVVETVINDDIGRLEEMLGGEMSGFQTAGISTFTTQEPFDYGDVDSLSSLLLTPEEMEACILGATPLPQQSNNLFNNDSMTNIGEFDPFESLLRASATSSTYPTLANTNIDIPGVPTFNTNSASTQTLHTRRRQYQQAPAPLHIDLNWPMPAMSSLGCLELPQPSINEFTPFFSSSPMPSLPSPLDTPTAVDFLPTPIPFQINPDHGYRWEISGSTRENSHGFEPISNLHDPFPAGNNNESITTSAHVRMNSESISLDDEDAFGMDGLETDWVDTQIGGEEYEEMPVKKKKRRKRSAVTISRPRPSRQCANCGSESTPSLKSRGSQRPYTIRDDGSTKAKRLKEMG